MWFSPIGGKSGTPMGLAGPESTSVHPPTQDLHRGSQPGRGGTALSGWRVRWNAFGGTTIMSVALLFAAWEAAVDAFQAARVTVVCHPESLHPGDVMEAEIESVGVLRTPVREPG
jgi:2-keto-4-pentenoate hydratase/2-oxohepta-3-ene-1,7-dioic acid hydratase in catechol pathway